VKDTGAVTAEPGPSLFISAPKPSQPMGVSKVVEKDRFVQLDIIRLILTGLVTSFHGLSELTFFLTEGEVEAMLRSPLGRVAAVGQGCVDGFFCLTGALATRQLLKRYAETSRPKPSAREVLDGYYSRFVGLMLPMFLWAAIYLFAFRNGKYPYSSVRADAVVKGMLHSGNATTAGLVPGLPAAPSTMPVAFGTMRDAGAMWWPWMLAGLGNLAPFGGPLQNFWSIAVQWQFYLFLPWIPFLLPYVAKLKKFVRRLCCIRTHPTKGHPMTWEEEDELEAQEGTAQTPSGPILTPQQVINVALFGLFWSLLFRFLAYRKLSDFDPKSLVGFGLDFAAYSNTATRMAPFLTGGIAAALSSDEFGWLVDWFKGGHSRSWHIALSRNALVRLLDLNVIVLTLVNAFWKELAALPDHDPITGKTKHGYLLIHELAYGLVRPGGILSALAYGWLVFSAMHGISWHSIYSRGRRSTPPTPKSPPSVATAIVPDAGQSTAVAAAAIPAGLKKRGVSAGRSSSPKAAPSTSTTPVVTLTTAATPKPQAPKAPSFSAKLMGMGALMGFSIYLVNSQIYESAYGWPDRLHPCPQLLHPEAAAAGNRLLYHYYDHQEALAGASTNPLIKSLHAVESAASRVVTAVFQLLKGPDDLYCSPRKGVPSGYFCRGACFGNALQSYDPRSAAQNVFLAAEGISFPQVPQVDPRLGTVGAAKIVQKIPSSAWLQFLHYAGICIFLTLIVAAVFHFLVERPVTSALSNKEGIWRRVFYWPVVIYCVVTLVLSLPALATVDLFILFKVTTAVEASVAAGGV
jgi:peptidoglycan/LPS O-acetylase OafA/YrhL